MSRESARPVELPTLTSLRGLAALSVLLYHASFIAARYGEAAPPLLFRRGYLAVDLFFLLSGFVLAHVYGRSFAAGRNWRLVASFLWARFCRVYPTSLFAAAVFLLPVAVRGVPWPPQISLEAQLVATLFLAQVPWLKEVYLNSPSWSISAEFYSYLLFPLIAPVIFRMNRRATLTLGVVLLLAVAADRTLLGRDRQVCGWGALVCAVPEFTCGIFAYRIYAERCFRDLLRRDVVLLGIVAAVCGTLVAGAADGLIVSLLLLVLLAVVSNDGRAADLLTLAPLRSLGDVSYSVYIFQVPTFLLVTGISGVLVAHGFGGAWFIVFAASLAVASGVLVHRCVDVPARAALRRLPDRLALWAGGWCGPGAAAVEPPPAPLPGRGR